MNYIFDTCALLSNPSLVEEKMENKEDRVIIPHTVFLELTNLKKGYLDSSRLSREVLNLIAEKWIYESNFEIYGDIDHYNIKSHSVGIDNDGVIFEIALRYRKLFGESTLLTADKDLVIYCRNHNLKNEYVRIEIEHIGGQKILSSEFKGYKIFRYGESEDIDQKITNHYANISNQSFSENVFELYPNEYICIEGTKGSSLGRWDSKKKKIVKLQTSDRMSPKNMQQAFAIDMMLNKESPIKIIAGGFGCVDMDTEFFDGSKWKKISEYEDGDMVLQYNKDKTTSLVKPIEYHKYPENKLYHIKNKVGNLDQVLSEDHNVLYRIHKDKKNPNMELRKKTFKELYIKEKKKLKKIELPRVFRPYGDGIALSDDEIRLIVWAITDGSYNYNTNSSRIRFNLKKQRKIDRLTDIIERLGYEYVITKKDNGYTKIYVDSPSSNQIKEFPIDWYNATREQFELIVEECIASDGCVCGNRTSFSTTSLHNANFVQFAMTCCEKNTSISINDRVGEEYMTNGKVYIRKSVEYEVIPSFRNKSNFSSVSNPTVTIEEFIPKDGFKYCFSVPSEMLIFRRNGSIFVTGNSGKSFLATQYAWHESIGFSGKKIMFVRNPMGDTDSADVGFLKGDLLTKLMPYFMPIVDNLEGGEAEFMKKMDQGKLELMIPLHAKGRSLKNTTMVVDEAEDLTIKTLKLLGSRIGENSEVIFSGDYLQSERAYLNNNGLVHFIDISKGLDLVSCVVLEEDVRSEASKIFADM